MIKCVKCDNECPGIKKEFVGVFLLLIIVPYIYFFGIYASTIIWSLLFFCTGSYWIATRPSKRYVCKKCISVDEKFDK